MAESDKSVWWRLTRTPLRFLFLLAVSGLSGPAATYAQETLPDNDVLMRAMVDELERSMNELVLEDLPRPYFIQFRAEDRLSYTMSAAYGGLLESSTRRTRPFRSRVRVGSHDLDNTNAGRGGGMRVSLPLDDDYAAIRHTIWRATDADYKNAVEALTRKTAYLKDKTIEDRPADFTPAEPVHLLGPSAKLGLDRPVWEKSIELLSARFKEHPRIRDSVVELHAAAANNLIVNSEGTRFRKGDTGVYIEVDAEIQAEDGMLLSDRLRYLGEQTDQLPPVEQMLTDIDEMCAKLVRLAEAPQLDQYTGPVLFEPVAAAKVFEALFADAICARPVPLGRGGGWGSASLEKKLGLRVLPRSFQAYDDPGSEWFEEVLLAGSYEYDDEAVPVSRVSVVEKGVLKGLVASRAPTKKVKKTTGHGRSAGLGDARATIGCLYLSDDHGLSAGELHDELIQTARDEGLEYGLRIAAMRPGGYGNLGSPIYAYKVHVENGREELVRGLEFLPVETRALKRILAAGTERKAYNSIVGVGRSIVCPAILLEELDLKKFAEEFDKPPILKSPATRDP